MRLLFESLGYGEGDNLGGSSRVAAANAQTLAARGHEVTFLCTNRIDRREALYTDTVERVMEDGIRVVYLRTTTIPWWPGSFGPQYVHGLRARLDRELAQHDVAHLYEYRSALAWGVAAAARRQGVPYVLQPQGTLRTGERSKRLKWVYDRWIGRNLIDGAGCLVAGTTREQQQFVDSGVELERTVVVPNGLKLSGIDPLPKRGSFRAKWGISPKVPMILSVGRLELTKGQDILVEAFCQIDEPGAVLILVGPDHGLMDQLRRMVREAGREDSVILTGPLPEDHEVLEALVDSDIFVQPSRSEAFGMAILEACAASRPLLLSQACQNSDAFKDRAALVVTCTAAGLASGLQQLLEDEGLRARYGAEARVILKEKYTLPIVADRLQTIYENLTGTQ